MFLSWSGLSAHSKFMKQTILWYLAAGRNSIADLHRGKAEGESVDAHVFEC
jgi:hypothetical protein